MGNHNHITEQPVRTQIYVAREKCKRKSCDLLYFYFWLGKEITQEFSVNQNLSQQNQRHC